MRLNVAMTLLLIKNLQELDTIDNGDAIQSSLLKLTGQKTVPNVFINGQHLGGCDSTVAAKDSGKLLELLKG